MIKRECDEYIDVEKMEKKNGVKQSKMKLKQQQGWKVSIIKIHQISVWRINLNMFPELEMKND